MRIPFIAKSAAALLLGVTSIAVWANDPPKTDAKDRQEQVKHDNDHDSSQPMGDTWITTKVKTELLADSAVKGTDINVTTINGVVTLAGVLDNQVAIDKAITIAKNVKGVTDVDTRALKLRK
ncbi:BON domain-containing protein [Tahibacter amnicola]|uniref:BON domain-containing protein n=1 Tax=Tahibacter amnicola TaxID=2976241 RepID=A0ABY6BGR9_9GAMM|nr:BON domain-containing protein [Tahibacter amnicola]UXI69059.1 BON domain-containing protein [Tahibacter amnicola]